MLEIDHIEKILYNKNEEFIMNYKKLLISVFLLSLTVLVSGCGQKNNQSKSVIDESDKVPQAVQEQEKQQIAGEEPENQPNALDYMAPGYNKAQEKIKQVQDIRQQAIDENNKQMENINY